MSATALLLALVCLTATALAQETRVQVSGGPYYVDVPIDVQITTEGFERSPEPTVDVAAPAGARLELIDVSPSVSSSIQIVNGRMSRSESVRFVYRYQLTPKLAGRLPVGPFRIAQGATETATDTVRFEIEETPPASDQRIRLILPEGTLWVGQRVPLALEWWLTEAQAERLVGRRVRVPLFDRLDRFLFEDSEDADGSTTLTVDTAGGTLELPATVRRDTWQGQPYLVVTAKRALTALKAGTIEVKPASAITEEAVRWSTDFFGNRSPTQVRRSKVEDQPRRLTFEPPPPEDRPPSFAGAIGRGFSIEASADRSVVKAGDPVGVSLTIRGDTALETVSLPPLTESGLDPEDFGLPRAPVAGTMEDGGKRFEITLRVNHAGVEEIPPISFSWFDPVQARYQTTRTQPIALSVRPAVVVNAADVVTGEAATTAGDAVPPDGAPIQSPPADRGDRFESALSGADLALETRPVVLASSGRPVYTHPSAVASMYVGGLAILALAFALRRRRHLEPDERTRRKTLEQERRHLDDAHNPDEIANALRRMAATTTRIPRAELDAILLECDNLSYAPRSDAPSTLDHGLKTRASALADQLLVGVQ